jgi:hypothetical protein
MRGFFPFGKLRVRMTDKRQAKANTEILAAPERRLVEGDDDEGLRQKDDLSYPPATHNSSLTTHN